VGKHIRGKRAEAHPVYAQARFQTASEAVMLVEHAGFGLQDAASTLFWKPAGSPETEPRIETGVVPEAGFIGLLFTKAKSRPPRDHGTGDRK